MKKCVELLIKGCRCVANYGVQNAWYRAKTLVEHRCALKRISEESLYTQEELQEQCGCCFERDITFSILVPLYNTPCAFLKEMIASVQNQTYGSWELCLADGSGADHQEVEQICRAFAAEDPRIRYRRLEKNLGISGNTNACIEMAAGEYIALFDHDDVLHPAALYEAMKAICEKNADFVYTDEAVFLSPDISKITHIHFKPDYAVDNLRANNYICHFCVFSKKLLLDTDTFRSEYDGSQDHDLILRLTKNAGNIVHIPKVLYYWRAHPESVAMKISSKAYAVVAGRNAVRTSIWDAGLPGEVESTPFSPTTYRIHYSLSGQDKVSILISTRNNLTGIQRCVKSILEKSTYASYEIIIADAGADDQKLKAYYNQITQNARVAVISCKSEDTIFAQYQAAAQKAHGAYFVLLNDNIEILSPSWIEEMLMYVQRPDVAAAGSKIYAPNNTIRYTWGVLGMGKDSTVDFPYRHFGKTSVGYMGRLGYAQDVTAVSGNCLMVSAETFNDIGGAHSAWSEAYWDIDLCLCMREKGYLIVWTPYSEVCLHETTNRNGGNRVSSAMTAAFKSRWAKELAEGDPYYNPNFDLNSTSFLFSKEAKIRYCAFKLNDAKESGEKHGNL